MRRAVSVLICIVIGTAIFLFSLGPYVAIATPDHTYSWVKNIAQRGCPDNAPSHFAVSYYDDEIFVTDNNSRVDVLSEAGASLRHFSLHQHWSEYITPRDIIHDASGNMYVSEVTSNQVLKYSPSGTLLQRFGSTSPGPGISHEACS